MEDGEMKCFWILQKGNPKAKWQCSTLEELQKILANNWKDVDLAIDTLKEIGVMHGSPFTLVAFSEMPPEI